MTGRNYKTGDEKPAASKQILAVVCLWLIYSFQEVVAAFGVVRRFHPITKTFVIGQKVQQYQQEQQQQQEPSSTTTSSSPPPPPPQQQRVLVVGGGVGGLAVAARIAAACSSTAKPCQVVILEKNHHVGGRCGSVDIHLPGIGTFRHDRGPSLLLLPEVYKDLFHACCDSCEGLSSTSAEDYGLIIRPCLPAYQVVFDDGDRIDLGFRKPKGEYTVDTDEAISRQKMDCYESNGARKWDEYMSIMSAFLDCGLPNFIEERLDLSTFPDFLRESLRDFGKAWPLKPHSDVLDAIFESEKMRALASFQDLYVGLEPYRNQQQEPIGGGVWTTTAPAVFGLLAAIELHPSNRHSGVFAPIGGFRAVTNAFQRLAESKGVEILTNHTVVQIQRDGVDVLDNHSGIRKFMSADLVVVNADLPFATKCLLASSENATMEQDSSNNDVFFDWDDKYDFSSGVIAFHWSLNKCLDDLNTHNVFLVATSRSQAQASWRILRRGFDIPDDSIEPFNFYVHRASKTDPTSAPAGCDAIMILVPCKTLKRNEEYANLSRSDTMIEYAKQFNEEYISRVREAVLKRLSVVPSLEDLDKCILHEFVDTPANYADMFNLAAGSPFALSHGFGQLSIMRPGAQMAQYPNVLMVGASSRPGNGVPLVLIGAQLVARKAIELLQEQFRRTRKG